MNLDFQALMILALLTTGAVWLADKYYFAVRRQQRAEGLLELHSGVVDEETMDEVRKTPVVVEYAKSFFPIILIVLLLRSFLFEPFRIPSGSMMPTLRPGDFILVNKYAYGIRLPVVGTRVVDIGTPRRGDIAVFRYPKDPAVDYIKRIVGLPGDRISYYDKTLYINGERIDQESLGIYTGFGVGISASGSSLRLEKLGSVEHEILIQTSQRLAEGEFVVPEGHYFVMGDNRDNSNDSRFWGTVPEQNLVGKAFMIWMNWDSVSGTVLWDRIGNSIK